MGTLVKAFKNLKANVKALEDKVDNKINDEIKDIKKNQKVLEDLMKANSDVLKVVENVMLGFQKENQKAEHNKVVEKTNNELKSANSITGAIASTKLIVNFTSQ